ncbi:MAG: hypothetical protein GXO15_06735 [Crenarchaeota archaeon]|nr:hypothetical protein [Thermoproteota archaeon]
MKKLLNLAIMVLVLLPIIAPLAPTTTLAAAQGSYPQSRVTDTSGIIITDATNESEVNVTDGDYVVFQIYDPDVATENITAQIYVAGTENNVTVGFVGDVGTYQGKIVIVRVGTVAKVRYYYYDNATQSFVDMGYLNGSLTNGDNVTIIYKSPVSGNTTVIYVYYYVIPAYSLVIEGREHNGIYWIPRLGAAPAPQINVTAHYNAYEWSIKSQSPDFELGTLYNVSFQITNPISGLSCPPYSVIFNATDQYTLRPVNDTEADKIKRMILECIQTIGNPYYIEGRDFESLLSQGDTLLVNASFYNITTTTGVQSGVTNPSQVRSFVSIAKINVYGVLSYAFNLDDLERDTNLLTTQVGFFTPLIVFQVLDADANLNTMARETLPYPGEAYPSLNITDEQGNQLMVYGLQEVGGPNTADFAVMLSIFDLYNVGAISQTDNVVSYIFTEVRVDDPNAITVCYRNETFTVQYNMMTLDAVEKEVVLRDVIRCCPPLKITIVLTDKDLDLPINPSVPMGTAVAATYVTAGSTLTGLVLNYWFNGADQGVPALNMSIYLVDEAGNEYQLTATADFSIVFEAQGGGVAKAIIDLSKVNWGEVNEQAVAAGHKLVKIKVVVQDIYNPDFNTSRWLKACASLQNTTITLDRSELPISFRIVDSNFTTNQITSLASCPGCYPWINDTRNSDAQVVYIEIYDPGANKNCCEIDTIPNTAVNMSLVLYYPNGEYTVFNVNTGSAEVPIYAIETNGNWTRRGYCKFELSPEFTETGPNSSVFTGMLRIYSYIDVDGDGTLDIRVAGCPSIWLEGAKLKLHYTSPAIGFDEKAILFKTMDASLEARNLDNVNASVIQYGDTVMIKVVDPDANLDNRVNESVMVELSFYCPLIRDVVPHSVWLEENGSDTGVFVAYITIDSRYAGACQDLYCAPITVTYIDRTPVNPTTLQYGIQQLQQNLSINNGEIKGLLVFAECDCNKVRLETTLQHVPYKGEVRILYTVPGATDQYNWIVANNGVVPAYEGTLLKILVKDKDMNRWYNEQDTIDAAKVWIEIPDITPGPVSLASILTAIYGKADPLHEMDAIKNVTTVTTANGEVTIANCSFAPSNNSKVFVSVEFSLGQLVEALIELGYIQVPPTMTVQQVVEETIRQLAGKPIKVTYDDGQVACQANVCGLVVGTTITEQTSVYDMEGTIEIVNATSGEPSPDNVYRCGCVQQNCPSATGDVIDIIVKDVSLLKYYLAGQGLRVVGNLTMTLVYNGTTRPLVYGNMPELDTAGLEFIGVDGTLVPVAVYKKQGVLIYCTTPPLATRPYIVAPTGSRVYFTYKDPANATGAPVDVTTYIDIGVPALAQALNQTVQVPAEEITVKVYNGTAFVPTTVIKRGQSAYIVVPLSYDPNLVRSVAGGNQFYVLFIIRNAEGQVVAAAAVPVTVGQTLAQLILTSYNTMAMPAGTYQLIVMAVTDEATLVPLSTPAILTITIQ